MSTFIVNLLFLLITIYILISSISYSIYEIKQQTNLTGGIVLIIITTLSVIFANIAFWLS